MAEFILTPVQSSYAAYTTAREKEEKLEDWPASENKVPAALVKSTWLTCLACSKGPISLTFECTSKQYGKKEKKKERKRTCRERCTICGTCTNAKPPTTISILPNFSICHVIAFFPVSYSFGLISRILKFYSLVIKVDCQQLNYANQRSADSWRKCVSLAHQLSQLWGGQMKEVRHDIKKKYIQWATLGLQPKQQLKDRCMQTETGWLNRVHCNLQLLLLRLWQLHFLYFATAPLSLIVFPISLTLWASHEFRNMQQPWRRRMTRWRGIRGREWGRKRGRGRPRFRF